jgi:cytochrome c55X
MVEAGQIAGIALAAAVLTAGARAEPPAARQDELLYRLRQDCGSCHGMTLKGGLGPALLPGTLAQRPEDDLAGVILNGVPGTPMPPWAFEITDDEARWLARRLKAGLGDAG